MRRVSVCLVAMVCAAVHCQRLFAENWPVWRGPRGDGTSSEQNVPTQWNGADGTNVAWKAPIAGVGHSSPVIWNDRVFLTTCLEDKQQRLLLCLDAATGKLLWERMVIEAPLEKKHQLNSHASATPATDGKLVYVTFLEPRGEGSSEVSPGNMVVAAYDLEGNRKWLVRPGQFSSRHGYCSCPVLYRDKVIVNGDHDGDGFLVALDRQTGETLWKVDRPNKTRSYVTPIIRELGGRTQLILSGTKCVASYNPDDGSLHWILDGPTDQFVASPVENGELVFITAGFPEYHILAIRPDGRGELSDEHIVWRTTRGCAYVPSPIVCGPYFLVVADGGAASCFDAASGERHWMQRLGTRFSGSLVSAAGLVYFTADDGTITVVRPGKGYDQVAVNPLGERCYSSPAISGGRIYVRGERHLFCIGAR